MNPPKPVSGISKDAAWLNQLRAFCISIALRSGRNYRLVRSPQGTALDFDVTSGRSKASTPDSEYIVQSHGAYPGLDSDYILCVPSGSNPTDLSITPVKIKKPYLLRFSITRRIVQGQTINYDSWDSTAQSRVARNSLGAVIQTITPQYAPGDVIIAATINGELQDRNSDGRVFAAP